MSKDSLIEFGSHTCNHLILSRIPDEEVESELRDSKTKIEKWTGKSASIFAYPNGQSYDYTDDSKVLLEKVGYSRAFTLIRGVNTRDTNEFDLKRISIKDQSLPSFAHFLCNYL